MATRQGLARAAAYVGGGVAAGGAVGGISGGIIGYGENGWNGALNGALAGAESGIWPGGLYGGGAFLLGVGAPAAENVGLTTNANEAVFRSGIRNGESTAAQRAGRNSGTTLESAVAARGIRLPTWDPADPASVTAWRQASQEFAAGASGDVRVLQGNAVRFNSVWAEVEYPALRANSRVNSITSINPETGQEVLLWSR